MARTEWFSESRGLSALPGFLQPPVRHLVVRRRYLGLRGSDLLLAGHPKSGTTFLRIVLAAAFTGEEQDFDSVRDVSREIGQHRDLTPIVPGGGRLVKTHEPPAFPPWGARPRVLYLVRDGRDIAVSYYRNFQRLGFGAMGVDRFADLFTQGRVGPYGSWQDHADAWVRFVASSPSPASLVRYEDVLADPFGTLKAALEQLRLPVDDDSLHAAIDNNSVAKMREKEASSRFLGARSTGAGSFVRTAAAGGWKGQLDDDVLRRFETAAGPTLTSLGYPLSTSAAAG